MRPRARHSRTTRITLASSTAASSSSATQSETGIGSAARLIQRLPLS
jgi:hypothetical protein